MLEGERPAREGKGGAAGRAAPGTGGGCGPCHGERGAAWPHGGARGVVCDPIVACGTVGQEGLCMRALAAAMAYKIQRRGVCGIGVRIAP